MIRVSTRTLRQTALPLYRQARAVSSTIRRLPAAARRTLPELGRDLLTTLTGRPPVSVFVVPPASTEQRGLLLTVTRSIQAAASTGLKVELLVLEYDSEFVQQLSTLREHGGLSRLVTVRCFWRRAGHKRPERIVDLHPGTGRAVTHRYLTGDGSCWLSVWVDPEDGTPGLVFQHLPAARAYPSLRATQADWVREVIATTSRPLLIAGDGSGEEVLRAVNRIGSTKWVIAGEVTAAQWRTLVSGSKLASADTASIASLRPLSDFSPL